MPKFSGSTEQIPDRKPIVLDEEKAAPQEAKSKKREVGKRRLDRESNAVEKLKEILMKHSADAQ